MIVECEDDCTGMHNAGVGSRNRFTPGNFCVVASTLLIKVLCSSSGSSELRVAPTSIPVIFFDTQLFLLSQDVDILVKTILPGILPKLRKIRIFTSHFTGEDFTRGDYQFEFRSFNQGEDIHLD